MGERYTVVEDPCGLFFIWDENLLVPAMMGEDILAFVRSDSAGRIARMLNARANDEIGNRAAHENQCEIAVNSRRSFNGAERVGCEIPQR